MIINKSFFQLPIKLNKKELFLYNRSQTIFNELTTINYNLNKLTSSLTDIMKNIHCNVIGKDYEYVGMEELDCYVIDNYLPVKKEVIDTNLILKELDNKKIILDYLRKNQLDFSNQILSTEDNNNSFLIAKDTTRSREENEEILEQFKDNFNFNNEFFTLVFEKEEIEKYGFEDSKIIILINLKNYNQCFRLDDKLNLIEVFIKKNNENEFVFLKKIERLTLPSSLIIDKINKILSNYFEKHPHLNLNIFSHFCETIFKLNIAIDEQQEIENYHEVLLNKDLAVKNEIFDGDYLFDYDFNTAINGKKLGFVIQKAPRNLITVKIIKDTTLNKFFIFDSICFKHNILDYEINFLCNENELFKINYVRNDSTNKFEIIDLILYNVEKNKEFKSIKEINNNFLNIDLINFLNCLLKCHFILINIENYFKVEMNKNKVNLVDTNLN